MPSCLHRPGESNNGVWNQIEDILVELTRGGGGGGGRESESINLSNLHYLNKSASSSPPLVTRLSNGGYF